MSVNIVNLAVGQKILVEAEVAAVDEKNQCVLCLVEEANDKQVLCKVPLSAVQLPTPTE